MAGKCRRVERAISPYGVFGVYERSATENVSAGYLTKLGAFAASY